MLQNIFAKPRDCKLCDTMPESLHILSTVTCAATPALLEARRRQGDNDTLTAADANMIIMGVMGIVVNHHSLPYSWLDCRQQHRTNPAGRLGCLKVVVASAQVLCYSTHHWQLLNQKQ